MNRDMEFEASVKSGITPDVEFIKEHDEILKSQVRENSKNSPVYFLGFLLAAAAFFFVNKIVMALCALIGVAALFLYVRRKKFVREVQDEDYLREVYEEGLLTPGMIVKTDPLTMMAIADIRAQEDCETQYACYVLKVERLPGARGELYEKIPCASMFRYEKGDYHASYRPHPLYWGTQNQEEIRAALRKLEEEQEENRENEWEVLRRISAAFPDLQSGQMLKLNASYTPVGIKQEWDDEYIPVITEQVRARYPKRYPDIPHITEDIPAADVYNQMIDLAVAHQVYEYISTHCKDRDYAPLSNPGYFTYVGDPLTFLEALGDRGVPLAEGEYPLIAGLMLVTTKGCWKKKEFIPWREITLDAGFSSLGGIETTVNGKCIVEFKPNTAYYQNSESFTKEDTVIVRQIELEGVHGFLKGLKELLEKE